MSLALHFSDGYTACTTRHASFDTAGVLPTSSSCPLHLEGLRELTLRRDQALCGECLRLQSSTLDYRLGWCAPPPRCVPRCVPPAAASPRAADAHHPCPMPPLHTRTKTHMHLHIVPLFF
jgi:hypothetical protein